MNVCVSREARDSCLSMPAYTSVPIPGNALSNAYAYKTYRADQSIKLIPILGITYIII